MKKKGCKPGEIKKDGKCHILVPVEIMKDVNEIVNYNYDGELTHYQESPPDHRKVHIFRPIARVGSFLTKIGMDEDNNNTKIDKIKPAVHS
jgi:hypothetical protein